MRHLVFVLAFAGQVSINQVAESQVNIEAMRQPAILREAYKRNVVVQTTDRFGSGIIIETGKVLTVFHNVEWGFPMVNGVSAEVVKFNETLDLILLSVPTVKVSKIRMDTRPYWSQPVFYVANPLGHVGFLSLGHIAFVSEWIETNTLPIPGMSGGGLYNTRGELIGMNARVEGDATWGYHIALHIKANTIKEFLEAK